MRRLLSSVVLTLVSTMFALAQPAAAADSYTVTATVSATNVDVGQSFTVRGKVSPIARKEWAIVQQHTSSGWVRVARDRINKYGIYQASVSVSQPGDNQYRVLKRHSNGHLRGVSATFTVTGWRWRALTSMPTSGASVGVSFPAGDLGTFSYPITYNPLIKLAGPNGSISYVLGKNCSKFEGDVGVTTDSTADTFQTADLGTFPEGGSATQILGQSVRRNQDPAHVVRSGAVISDAWGLNLFADATAGNAIGWGNARVYCKS